MAHDGSKWIRMFAMRTTHFQMKTPTATPITTQVFGFKINSFQWLKFSQVLIGLLLPFWRFIVVSKTLISNFSNNAEKLKICLSFFDEISVHRTSIKNDRSELFDTTNEISFHKFTKILINLIQAYKRSKKKTQKDW